MTSIASLYFEINLVLTVGFLIWYALYRLAVFRRSWISPRPFLRLSHWLIAIALFLPIANSLFVTNTPIRPAVQIWSASSGRNPEFSRELSQIHKAAISVGSAEQMKWFDANTLGYAVWLLLALGVVYGFIRFYLSVRALRRVLKSTYAVRKLGRVRILAHDELAVAFSCLLPGAASVVVPSRILLDPVQSPFDRLARAPTPPPKRYAMGSFDTGAQNSFVLESSDPLLGARDFGAPRVRV